MSLYFVFFCVTVYSHQLEEQELDIGGGRWVGRGVSQEGGRGHEGKKEWLKELQINQYLWPR